MNDGKYPPEKLIHAGDLVEVLLADLQHLQGGQPEQVGAGRGESGSRREGESGLPTVSLTQLLLSAQFGSVINWHHVFTGYELSCN